MSAQQTTQGKTGALDTILSQLTSILNQHQHERVVVVGTTCCGKSTLLRHVPGSRDQDEEVFKHMTPEERTYVCQAPWTPEIGMAMTQLVRKYVISRPREPVFGTVVIDADVVVVLHISDQLLRQRTTSRGVSFDDAKNMQRQLMAEIDRSNAAKVNVDLG